MHKRHQHGGARCCPLRHRITGPVHRPRWARILPNGFPSAPPKSTAATWGSGRPSGTAGSPPRAPLSAGTAGRQTLRARAQAHSVGTTRPRGSCEPIRPRLPRGRTAAGGIGGSMEAEARPGALRTSTGRAAVASRPCRRRLPHTAMAVCRGQQAGAAGRPGGLARWPGPWPGPAAWLPLPTPPGRGYLQPDRGCQQLRGATRPDS